jgi:GlcNAc-P-P-Und epimerase
MISILGGSGFIGTRLCESLEMSGISDWNILDIQKSEKFPNQWRSVDVLNRHELDTALLDVKTVINLAAEHKDNVSPVSLYYDVNVQGARNVCEACETNGVKNIIFTSSVAIYGLNKPNPNENFEPSPSNHYGKSKNEAELVYREWQQRDSENRTLIIIRPTVVFGEGNRGNVYNLLKQIVSGKFLRIGKGENRKSMAYVGNIAAFLQFSIHNLGSGLHIFNYVDKPDLTTNELIDNCEKFLDIKIPRIRIPYIFGYAAGLGFDALSKLIRKEFPISSVRVQKFCATTQFNADKVHNVGFKAPFTLEHGLHRTLEYEFKKVKTE